MENMPWYAQYALNAFVTLLTTSLVIEAYKRRNVVADRKEEKKEEATAAEIIDRQHIVNELWAQVDKLTMAQEKLVNERIILNKEIVLAQARLQEMERVCELTLRDSKRMEDLQVVEIHRLEAENANLKAELARRPPPAE